MNSQLNSLLEVLNKLPERRPDKKVQLLIYFDESDSLAHFITPAITEKGMPITYYQALLRAINDWAKRDVIAVFLSTNSDMYALAPVATTVPSNRYQTNSDHLPPPIVETPFDCSPNFPLKADDVEKLTLSDVTTLKFITQFGRPLYVLFCNKSVKSS